VTCARATPLREEGTTDERGCAAADVLALLPFMTGKDAYPPKKRFALPNIQHFSCPIPDGIEQSRLEGGACLESGGEQFVDRGA